MMASLLALLPLMISTAAFATVDVGGQAVVGVFLQEDGRATSHTYVESGPDALPRLTKFSLCVRFHQLNGGQPATIFSYTNGTAFEELKLAVQWPSGEVLVMCCNYHIHQYIKVAVRLFTWHHLCVAANLPNDTLHLAFDNTTYRLRAKRAESETAPGSAGVRPNGRFVLGQNINLNAEWDLTQSFHGYLADFRLYDIDLPLDAMENFTTCRADLSSVGLRYSFSKNMSLLQINGESQMVTLRLSELCRKTDRYLILLPERQIFSEALVSCKNFAGSLAVPRDSEENKWVFDEFIKFNDQCIQGWASLYWLGLKSNLSEKTWVLIEDDTPLKWGSWLEAWSTPSEQYPCATGAAINFPYRWYCADCKTLTCPLCTFTTPPTLRLRGLCRESKFDRTYTLHGYQNGRPVFEGYFFSRIVWGNNTWVLESRREEDVEARMVEKRPKGYPVGLASWETQGDSCGRQVEYLLTACGEGDFTCVDGSCVKIARRCDQVTDCSDSSDELNCEVLQVPHGYSQDLPPPTLHQQPLQLVLHLEVTSVRVFDLVAFTVQLDVLQSVTWHDARLTYANLLPGDFNNRAKVSDLIWLPTIMIKDAARSPTDVVMRRQILRINRESSPITDDDTRPREDKLYAGGEQSIRLEQQYTVSFMCQFSLHMYPFDIQHCLLSYTLTNIQDRFLFVKGGVNYTGERRLMEYKCVGEEMRGPSDLPGDVQMILEFRNQYGYYIGNAVVPSLLMVVICYLALFFDLHDFQDRIMVSLTSLLVLASLFSQTSQFIPKTAYLKHIDVWYICLISIDFIIILVLVAIENFRLKYLAKQEYYASPTHKMVQVGPAADINHKVNSKQKTKTKTMYKSPTTERSLQLHELINKISLIFIPVASVLFVFIFFLIAFLKFRANQMNP
ncbi:uncharacterized protein [Procambarus clarkii]|uniref:uncharacterized protein isoform X2 n=1 Tax=Procambarus clarkii TaxID=6728 RepID=UPI001E6708C9|nr:uncharacterized protein LOC123768752 isoform X2 [Procambarus clarkii]XP_045615470.1 uncharacterized protein LOC123768752 isoform X2 [Procambarus clarkii]XP_045615471.1 uncharacterized protein LOC123768752 isoform X2 [Procambarus clarkii]XP_045615472.1 uncharacterized protein LOC123768752 isoform X2 [Procambarus clarkii]